MPNYHVRRDGRTTVSLDEHLSRLLALHLNCEPNSREARVAICAWLQAEIDRNPVADRGAFAKRVIETLIRPEISVALDIWQIERDVEERERKARVDEELSKLFE